MNEYTIHYKSIKMATDLSNYLHVQVDATFTCTCAKACKLVDSLLLKYNLDYVERYVGRTKEYTVYSISLAQHAQILEYLKEHLK